MSNLSTRLRRLWVDWCAHHKPDPDGTPWPGEAFLQWAARELRCELIAVLGDDQQCKLLHELNPQVQAEWPAPPHESAPPTDPACPRPSEPPPAGLRELFGAPLPLRKVADDRSDLTQKGELKAGGTLTLTYYPTSFFRFSWLELTSEGFHLGALGQVQVRSFTVNLEEQLVAPCPLLLFTGEQNDGLIRMKAVSPGDRICIQLRNDSTHDLTVELRLHGVEPVPESETT